MTHLTNPWVLNVIAIVLASIGAVCFATAAMVQHRAVARTLAESPGTHSTRRLSLAAFLRLARQPRWLAGFALMAAGGALHVAALTLAPISVVQPIGVLAVPIAVLLTARSAHIAPSRAVVVGATLSVAGTVAFVLLTSSTSASGVLSSADLVTGLLLVLPTVAVLWLVARRSSPRVRCLALAGMAAVSYGFGSTLIRVLAQLVTTQSAQLYTPLTLVTAVTMVAAMGLGGWSVQQAYAAGPAQLVISFLTVGDPLIAVLLGLSLLDEGANISAPTIAAMVACAAAIAAGVALLASHHPQAVERTSETDDVGSTPSVHPATASSADHQEPSASPVTSRSSN